MRITHIRILVQTVCFVFFCLLVGLTGFTHLEEWPNLRLWLSKFLEIDPLIGIATAISTHTIYKGLLWGLVILIPTLLIGRFFCNWVCPFGTMHHFVGRAFKKRSTKDAIEANRYRPMFALKYYILFAMLVMAAFGNLQIGLLDPIVFLYRAFAVNIIPAGNLATEQWFGDPHMHRWSWILGALLLFFLAMNLIIPRFFCRTFCPLGALLGIFSRFALWRIDRSPSACTNCNLCARHCEGAADPHKQIRMSECTLCMNCLDDCPHDGFRFAYLPSASREIRNPDISRRRSIFSLIAGISFFAWAKTSGRSTRDFSAEAVRPPGSVEESEFLERCVKCGQCIRVCPSNVIQPALLEAGIEGLWTPVMNYRMGACQYSCTACGQVCPTGAIQQLTPEEKLGIGPYSSQGPVRLGTAHYDLGRCLPWSKNIPCMVCEEVCPVSPKAIHAEYALFLIREGKKVVRIASRSSITLEDFPPPGQVRGEPCIFTPHEFKGDATQSWHIRIQSEDGLTRTLPILDNDVDTILLDGSIDPPPSRGTIAGIFAQLKVPKIDTSRCIGCGSCEFACPVAGDRRAVHITAEGETRSMHANRGNRSLRLLRK